MLSHILREVWPDLTNVTMGHADCGRQALDLMKSATYDLVFMDIMMQEMNGPTVIRAMRATGIQTPVIVITAMDQMELANMSLPTVTTIVSKPIEMDEMRDAVLAVLMPRAGSP
jgi:CheY-like chemotaxis protein